MTALSTYHRCDSRSSATLNPMGSTSTIKKYLPTLASLCVLLVDRLLDLFTINIRPDLLSCGDPIYLFFKCPLDASLRLIVDHLPRGPWYTDSIWQSGYWRLSFSAWLLASTITLVSVFCLNYYFVVRRSLLSPKQFAVGLGIVFVLLIDGPLILYLLNLPPYSR